MIICVSQYSVFKHHHFSHTGADNLTYYEECVSKCTPNYCEHGNCRFNSTGSPYCTDCGLYYGAHCDQTQCDQCKHNGKFVVEWYQ